MTHHLIKAALALGACLATPAAAEGYNTFVITIPYDISLPSDYTSVEIICGYTFSATDERGQSIGETNFVTETIRFKFAFDIIYPSLLS